MPYLRQPRKVGLILSGTLSVLGLAGLLSDPIPLKRIGLLLVSTGTLSAVSTLVSSHYGNIELEDLLDAEQGKFQDSIGAVKQELAIAFQERDSLRQKLEQVIADSLAAQSRLTTQTENVTADNQQLRLDIASLNQQLQAKRTNLQELVTAFTERMRSHLEQHIATSLVQLREDVLWKVERTRKDSPVVQSLEKLAETISGKANVYREIVEGITPDHANPLNDIDEFANIFCQLQQESAALKVKYRNSLNVEERLKLKNCVDRQYAVEQLEKLAKEQDAFRLTEQECSAEIESLLNNVDSLRAQLEAAEKPQLVFFQPEIRADHRMGNLIIKYFARHGILLDRCFAFNQDHQSELSFHSDRSAKLVKLEDLNKHSEPLQDLLHSLNEPRFTRDAATGLIKTVLQISPKPKREAVSDAEISRLWVSASEFLKRAATWERIRVTGGSESGKSPTVETIAIAILRVKKGVPVFYNPQHNSQKNYWTLLATGKRHIDSEHGFEELANLMDQRSLGNVPRSEFRLYVFDEIDSTIKVSEDAKHVADVVKTVYKQASHQNLGVIVSGQSSNANEIPHMTHSDWESAVCVHIGKNCLNAITHIHTVSSEQKNLLKERAAKLVAYCEEKNKKLGLDPTADPKAYRFALVVHPTSNPYFVELPEFGRHQYQPPGKSYDSPEKAVSTSAKAVPQFPPSPKSWTRLDAHQESATAVSDVRPDSSKICKCGAKLRYKSTPKTGANAGRDRWYCESKKHNPKKHGQRTQYFDS